SKRGLISSRFMIGNNTVEKSSLLSYDPPAISAYTVAYPSGWRKMLSRIPTAGILPKRMVNCFFSSNQREKNKSSPSLVMAKLQYLIIVPAIPTSHRINKQKRTSTINNKTLVPTAHPTALVKKRSKKDAGKNCSICDTIYAAKPKITPMLPDVEPAKNKRLNDIFSEGPAVTAIASASSAVDMFSGSSGCFNTSRSHSPSERLIASNEASASAPHPAVSICTLTKLNKR